MVVSPKLKISKYFGSANIQQTICDLEEANGQLGYFWTKEGGSNIIVSVDGQQIKSFAELQAVAAQERYQKKAFIEVGLFLSNDGTQSIWPSRGPQ